MMSEKIFFLLSGIIALVSCNSHSVDIRTVCSRDPIGNYMIIWETDPQMEGYMKYYVSNDPDRFNTSRPSGYVNINDNVTRYVTDDNITRTYFLLTFNDKYPQIVTSRPVIMDHVANLRDMGGYTNRNEHATRWGKVYRSGSLSNLTVWDSVRIARLGVKTIIDLRTEEEVFRAPIKYKNATIVNIPVTTGSFKDIYQRLLTGRVRKGDGILFMQDLYLQYITENSAQFRQALELFLNEENYPIMFSCTYGKDRAGFLAALLLAALDVPDETIYRDYLYSNHYFLDSNDPLAETNGYVNRRLTRFARRLKPDAQETMTVMLKADQSLLELAFRKIRRDYGSVDKYLAKELNINEKKRSQLKDILLY